MDVIGKSFLCGNPVNDGTCKECHSSCDTCTSDGLCSTCKAAGTASKAADGAVCVCSNGGYADFYHTECVACHESCETCGFGGDSDSCRSCKANGATLPPNNGLGQCACRTGFLYANSPTAPCIPCAPGGCPYCIGTDPSECMSPDEAEFVQFTREYLSLPMLEESRGLVCFRQSMLTHDCVPDAIEQITGPILDYGTGAAKPTKHQCYHMLKANWPFVTYWFNKLFPGFVGPRDSTSLELLSIRAVVYLWILQFGASVMDSWTDMKTVVTGSAGAI